MKITTHRTQIDQELFGREFRFDFKFRVKTHDDTSEIIERELNGIQEVIYDGTSTRIKKLDPAMEMRLSQFSSYYIHSCDSKIDNYLLECIKEGV